MCTVSTTVDKRCISTLCQCSAVCAHTGTQVLRYMCFSDSVVLCRCKGGESPFSDLLSHSVNILSVSTPACLHTTSPHPAHHTWPSPSTSHLALTLHTTPGPHPAHHTWPHPAYHIPSSSTPHLALTQHTTPGSHPAHHTCMALTQHTTPGLTQHTTPAWPSPSTPYLASPSTPHLALTQHTTSGSHPAHHITPHLALTQHTTSYHTWPSPSTPHHTTHTAWLHTQFNWLTCQLYLNLFIPLQCIKEEKTSRTLQGTGGN